MILKTLKILLYSLCLYSVALSQQFETIPPDFIAGSRPLRLGKILCTSKGTVLIAHSFGVAEIDAMQIQIITTANASSDGKGNKSFFGKNSNIFRDQYDSITGIKLMCEGPGKIIYVVSNHNNFGCINYNFSKAIGPVPFNFTAGNTTISKIWLDEAGDLFVANNTDTIYTVANATKPFGRDPRNSMPGTFMVAIDKDSNLIVTQGALTIKKFSLGKGIIPYSFAQGSDDARIVLIGTNKGLYAYDKQNGQSIDYLPNEKDSAFTITGIEENKIGSIIWFSTLEKGMGKFNLFTKGLTFFEYPKQSNRNNGRYPVLGFSRKSANDFFVSIADSVPAVFNTETGKYSFINDTIFNKTANATTDIQADALGNLYVSKGGGFYWSKKWMQNNSSAFKTDSSLYGPFITDILLNGTRYNSRYEFYSRYEVLKEINLKYNENSISLFYSCRGVNQDSLVYAWTMDNFSKDWITLPYSVLGDEMNSVNFDDLKPGTYTFRIRARSGTGPWLKNQAQLIIHIAAPFWQTWWFWLSVITGIALIIFGIVKWRVNAVRKQERLKTKHEKELLELEAKALRAQMNPHFIFNCLNSIKSLIQQDEEEKAVTYLTTFSRLIRTLFNNADKKEISLFDEVETCKLYLQLESMRFDKKFSFNITIDNNIDLKSIQVPALIIQPFLENAIWHGIMPGNKDGNVSFTISRSNEILEIIIDDNGVGRKASLQNKPAAELTHQSKGVSLTQSRLQLNNLLQQRRATLEIIDKTNANGLATGTTVIIKISEES